MVKELKIQQQHLELLQLRKVIEEISDILNDDYYNLLRISTIDKMKKIMDDIHNII